MKQRLKTIFFAFSSFLARIGMFFGWKPGAIVLMYHAVNVEGGKLSVSPEVFRSQMEYIRDARSVVSMEDILLSLDGQKTLPKGAVAVSIDDGYLDTYREAFPVLKEFRIPFTLFLTTNLREMPALANLPRPTWDQLREMSAVGLMTIGLHGHDHLHVNEIAGDTVLLEKELKDSAETIAKETGKAPTVYAYAFGARDARIPPYLRTLGITAGFGITDGAITSARDRYALPRVQVDRTMSPQLFQYRTEGAVEVAFLIKRNLRRWASRIWKRSP